MVLPGRLEVVGPLPESGASGDLLGVVVLGRDVDPVPVRLVPIPARVAGDPELLARLRRGATAVAELQHPNILRTFGIEDVQGTAMRVLAYVEAHSLRTLVQVGARLPPQIAARIVLDACQAVQYAHEQGRGGARVAGELCLDTVLVAESGSALVAGLGLPPPMPPPPERRHLLSPEQVADHSVALSPETDVYLLGALLHALLAGEPLFAEEADPEAAVLGKAAPSLADLGVAGPLAEVVARALAKRPQDRCRSPAALAEEIARAVGELVQPAAVSTYVDLLFPVDDQGRAARRAAAEAAVMAHRPAPDQPSVAGAASPPAQPVGSARAQPPPAEPHGEAAEPPPPEIGPTPTSAAGGTSCSVPAGLASTADIVAEVAERTAALDLVSTADIVAEVAERTAVPDLVSTADIVTEAAERPAVPDLVSTADIIGIGEVAALPSEPDLVSSTDILEEPATVPSSPGPAAGSPLETAAPVPAGRSPGPAQVRPVAYRMGMRAFAAAALGCLGVGFCLSFFFGLGVPASPIATSPAPQSALEEAVPPTSPSALPAAAPATLPPPMLPPVPAVAVPVPERRAPASLALLSVSADPPGSVYLDGKLAGHSPLARQVSRGLHKVRLRDPSIGIDVTQVVEVRGAEARVRFALRTGTLTVTAPDGARIFVDGRLVGTTAVRNMAIWEGEHRILVTLGTARDSHVFQLRAGEPYRYVVTQTPAP